MAYRAFVSSTFLDLKDHRYHVIGSLRRAGFMVDPMEDWTSDSDEPKKFSQDRLDGCDLCILLVAFRRGYVPDGETMSITQLEYEAALRKGIDILPFMLDESAPWFHSFDELEKDPEIKRWRVELRKRHGVQPFNLEPRSIDMTGPLGRWLTKKNAERQSQATVFGKPSRRPQETPPTITWDIEKDQSPYPGLMHFTHKYARVFFGRDDEVREILYRMKKPEGRFMIISGDSGVGKSSIVDAGILPKLEDGGLPSKESCKCVRMVPGPGSQPFGALMTAVGWFATRAGLRPEDMIEELEKSPDTLTRNLRKIMTGAADGRTLVLFLDQMEELFTAQHVEQSYKFLTALYRATQEKTLWVVATIRSDHLQFCYRHPEMLAVLQSMGHYPLGRVDPFVMQDMILKPAACAGLTIPDKLVRRIIEDIRSAPGNLPLLAFVLQRLFEKRSGDALSETVYEAGGGVLGAISDHVRTVEDIIAKEVSSDPLDLLRRIFDFLVIFSIDRLPTRRRISIKQFPEDLGGIINILVKHRLLSTEGEGEKSTISVAHEKLFEAWPALARWVVDNRDELMIMRQAEMEGREWANRDYDLRYLWHEDRLKRLQEIIRRHGSHDLDPDVRQYSSPQLKLIEYLNDPSMSHHERQKIGSYLAVLGDPRPGVGLVADGIPDIEWVDIPGGRVMRDVGEPKWFGFFWYRYPALEVKPFRIARYPVTNIQFEAFVNAQDGYGNHEWWEGIERGQEYTLPTWNDRNCPCQTVSWYEAMAFCRWLTQKYRRKKFLGENQHIRLPTEWEWQQAATGGNPANTYPWGPNWKPECCNHRDNGLNRTTAVGIYPNGATKQGLMDMAGNVSEWCLNKLYKPGISAVDRSGDPRAVAGASRYSPGPWEHLSSLKRNSAAYDPARAAVWSDVGFRLLLNVH